MRELVGLSAIISAVYTWQVEVVVLGTATLFHLKEELLSLQTAARGHMHVCADHCGRGHTCCSCKANQCPRLLRICTATESEM